MTLIHSCFFLTIQIFGGKTLRSPIVVHLFTGTIGQLQSPHAWTFVGCIFSVIFSAVNCSLAVSFGSLNDPCWSSQRGMVMLGSLNMITTNLRKGAYEWNTFALWLHCVNYWEYTVKSKVLCLVCNCNNTRCYVNQSQYNYMSYVCVTTFCTCITSGEKLKCQIHSVDRWDCHWHNSYDITTTVNIYS